jgi:hypothetical protein
LRASARQRAQSGLTWFSNLNLLGIKLYIDRKTMKYKTQVSTSVMFWKSTCTIKSKNLLSKTMQIQSNNLFTYITKKYYPRTHTHTHFFHGLRYRLQSPGRAFARPRDRPAIQAVIARSAIARRRDRATIPLAIAPPDDCSSKTATNGNSIADAITNTQPKHYQNTTSTPQTHLRHKRNQSVFVRTWISLFVTGY